MERDRIDAVAAIGLMASGAGLGVIDTNQEKLLPLFGKPLGLPQSPSGQPLDLAPVNHNRYLSEEATNKLLRATRGALPAQLQIQVGGTLFALFLASPDNHRLGDYLPEELRVHHFTSTVLVITFPIKNIENFMLRPEEAGVLAMPLLESFHELARPIGLTSMLLTKLRLDTDLAAALQKTNLRSWHDLNFITMMISECFYPMIKYLGLIEKYGQVGIGEYTPRGYRLGRSLKDTIQRFLKALRLARVAPLFHDFGISPSIFDVREEVCGFGIPENDPLVEIPRSLLDVVATELLLNALKYLPKSLPVGQAPAMEFPVEVSIEHVNDEIFNLHFSNMYQPQRHIGNLREFKHSVLSRPLGGLAGVKRLVHSVGWNLDFSLHPMIERSNGSIYIFDVEIKGYQLQGQGEEP